MVNNQRMADRHVSRVVLKAGTRRDLFPMVAVPKTRYLRQPAKSLQRMVRYHAPGVARCQTLIASTPVGPASAAPWLVHYVLRARNPAGPDRPPEAPPLRVRNENAPGRSLASSAVHPRLRPIGDARPVHVGRAVAERLAPPPTRGGRNAEKIRVLRGCRRMSPVCAAQLPNQPTPAGGWLIGCGAAAFRECGPTDQAAGQRPAGGSVFPGACFTKSKVQGRPTMPRPSSRTPCPSPSLNWALIL